MINHSHRFDSVNGCILYCIISYNSRKIIFLISAKSVVNACLGNEGDILSTHIHVITSAERFVTRTVGFSPVLTFHEDISTLPCQSMHITYLSTYLRTIISVKDIKVYRIAVNNIRQSLYLESFYFLCCKM